jgi:hypothetical protein
LILAVAGGAFAQELKISGSLNSGLEGTSTSYDADQKGVDDEVERTFKAYPRMRMFQLPGSI